MCLFLLPWQRRLAPPSICSFGTYSCYDYEQSLIKLQRIIPRNHCVCVCVCVRGCLTHYFALTCSRLHACAWVIGAYCNSCEFASVIVRGLLLFALLFSLSCRWHQMIPARQIPPVCFFFPLITPQNGQCQIQVLRLPVPMASVTEGVTCDVVRIYGLLANAVNIYSFFSTRGSHVLGSLATCLITILRRRRQSSGSLTLGN